MFNFQGIPLTRAEALSALHKSGHAIPSAETVRAAGVITLPVGMADTLALTWNYARQRMTYTLHKFIDTRTPR